MAILINEAAARFQGCDLLPDEMEAINHAIFEMLVEGYPGSCTNPGLTEDEE